MFQSEKSKRIFFWEKQAWNDRFNNLRDIEEYMTHWNSWKTSKTNKRAVCIRCFTSALRCINLVTPSWSAEAILSSIRERASLASLINAFCSIWKNNVHFQSRLKQEYIIAGFFKENVRYPVWICRDPISLILGDPIFADFRDPMIIFSDSRDPIWNSRDPNRVPKTP